MAIDEYLTKYNEIVELCEDYWHLLRVESSLFTHFPKKMFARKSDQNALLNQISRSFILQMISISIFGMLVSH